MPTPAERVSELDAQRAVFAGTDAGRSAEILGIAFSQDAEAPNGYRATIEAQVKTGSGVVVERCSVYLPTPAGWRTQLDAVFTAALGAWKTERGVP